MPYTEILGYPLHVACARGCCREGYHAWRWKGRYYGVESGGRTTTIVATYGYFEVVYAGKGDNIQVTTFQLR